MLDNRHGLSGEDGLVNSEGGGVDLDDPEVGGHLVSHGDLDDVSGNNLHRLNLLHAVLVRSREKKLL